MNIVAAFHFQSKKRSVWFQRYKKRFWRIILVHIRKWNYLFNVRILFSYSTKKFTHTDHPDEWWNYFFTHPLSRNPNPLIFVRAVPWELSDHETMSVSFDINRYLRRWISPQFFMTSFDICLRYTESNFLSFKNMSFNETAKMSECGNLCIFFCTYVRTC